MTASSGLAGDVSARMAARTSGRRSSTHPLGEREVGELQVGGPGQERVEGLEPDQQVERAAADLAAEVGALGVGLLRPGAARRATGRGRGCAASRAKLTGRPMAAERRRIQSTSRSGAARSSPIDARGRELEHAGAELAEHRADAEQLVLGGEGAGHRLAVDGRVQDRARRREAERAGARCRRARCSAMAAMSSAVAGSLRAPRSPIT